MMYLLMGVNVRSHHGRIYWLYSWRGILDAFMTDKVEYISERECWIHCQEEMKDILVREKVKGYRALAQAKPNWG